LENNLFAKLTAEFALTIGHKKNVPIFLLIGTF
jgi:hypothetical protein